MSTFVYMVRHGESPKEGNDRARGLTEKGYFDAKRVTNILKDKEIDVVVSSPYIRSILTVEQLAQRIGEEVLVFEDLKERIFSSGNNRVSDKELVPLLERSFSESNFSLEGGESNAFRDKKIVIGTHGAVMTLIMGYFDSTYDLDFLHSISKPDIYRMEFNEQELVNVQRLWGVNIGVNQ